MVRVHVFFPLVVLVLPGCFTEQPPMISSSTTGPPPTTTQMPTTTVDPSTSATTDPDSGTTESADDTTETGPPIICGAPDGDFDPTCLPETPFCVAGDCVPCTDPGAGACTVAAGGTICDEDGRCVECTPEDASACSGTTPVCGPEGQCLPCTAHDQCTGGAGCHLFEGSCLPPDQVIEVPAVGSIADALLQIGVGGMGTIRILPGNFTENLTIPSGAVVALVADGSVRITGTGGLPTIEVLNNTTAYLGGIDLENIQIADGVVSAGDVRLDECTLRLADRGLVSTGGRVHLERTRVIDNEGAGLLLGGSDPVVLRNAIVAGNGFGMAPAGVVSTAPTPLTILYSTIADNAGAGGGALDSAAGMGEVRNSILVSGNLTNSIVSGPGLDFSNCVVADSALADQQGNVGVADLGDLMFDADWEVGPASLAQDVAVWQPGDPQVDINGAMRPNMDGAMDYAGADRAD